jgi:ribosomal protein S18 acetylase RimI-like enzyme
VSDLEIRLARPDEAEVLGAALADALTEDPLFRWLFPAGPGRDERLLTFFTMMSVSYLNTGKPYLVDDDAGAPLWSDPETGSRLQLDLGQARRLLGSFGLSRVVRGLRTHKQMDKLHPGEPRWHLGYLGVRRSRQGHGLGGALLDEVLTRADDARVAAAVESSNERNLSFYQRHGFEIVEEINLLGTGPSVWRMWRKAAS